MEPVRFPCPACGASLRAPAAAEPLRGPCPHCDVEIIGPAGDQAPRRAAPQPPGTFAPFPGVIRKPATASEPPSPATNRTATAETAAATETKVPAGTSVPIAKPAAPTTPPPPTVPLRPPHPEDPPEPPPPTPPTTPAAAEPATSVGTTEDAGTPPRSRAGRWIAAAIIAALLAGAIALIANFPTPAESSAELPPPATPPDPTPPGTEPYAEPEATSSPAPPPAAVDEAWSPPPDDDPPDAEAGVLGPRATLEAFLDAPDWEARAAHVVSPEAVGERMREVAESEGDGPIAYESIELRQVNEDSHIFQLHTEAMPDGFPVAVLRTGESWRVEWQSFHEFHRDRFGRFAAGELGDRGLFHLMIKPLDEPAPNRLFHAYQVSPPLPDRTRTAYAREDARVYGRLQAIFSTEAGLESDDFRDLMQGPGLPVVVELSYHARPDGQSFLRLERLVANGWGPAGG